MKQILNGQDLDAWIILVQAWRMVKAREYNLSPLKAQPYSDIIRANMERVYVGSPLTLQQILTLVGKLDDLPGNETPRERFRHFLKQNVSEVGQVRDYIEECLRTSGDQYNCALQDLVNRLGELLGFTVTYGRYRGVQGQIGFDGYWQSPSGFHIVPEVKTTDAYAIKATTLVGYIDGLISEKAIPSWEHAMGLYVVGRPDAELKQLENAIIAERRTQQLRIISTESLLSLAEMMNEYKVAHEEILALLRPSVPRIDRTVDLMARLVAEQRSEKLTVIDTVSVPEGLLPQQEPTTDTTVYWLTPVKSDGKGSAEEIIQSLVGQKQMYAFGDNTPGRKHIKPEDWICFYANGKGVIAHAKIVSLPEKKTHRLTRHPEKYPWVFRVANAVLYLDTPVVISAEVRKNLDAFSGRDPNNPWAWFVQATHKLTGHDFNLLIDQLKEKKITQ